MPALMVQTQQNRPHAQHRQLPPQTALPLLPLRLPPLVIVHKVDLIGQWPWPSLATAGGTGSRFRRILQQPFILGPILAVLLQIGQNFGLTLDLLQRLPSRPHHRRVLPQPPQHTPLQPHPRTTHHDRKRIDFLDFPIRVQPLHFNNIARQQRTIPHLSPAGPTDQMTKNIVEGPSHEGVTVGRLWLFSEEVVLQDLADGEAFVGVLHHAVLDEVLSRPGQLHRFGEEHLLLDDLGQILRVPDLEGNRPIQQLVSQHPQTPHVDLAVVVVRQDHLRGRVERSPALGVPEERGVNSPPEICNFDRILMNKHILRLDIPVNHIPQMHVLNRRAHLLNLSPHVLLGQTPHLQLLVKISVQTGLEKQVDALGVGPAPVEMEDVGMVQETLDSHLTSQLVQTACAQFAFLYHFQTQQKSSIHMLHQVDFPGRSLIQKANHIELFLPCCNSHSETLPRLARKLRRGCLNRSGGS